jgi:hypothetical protein
MKKTIFYCDGCGSIIETNCELKEQKDKQYAKMAFSPVDHIHIPEVLVVDENQDKKIIGPFDYCRLSCMKNHVLMSGFAEAIGQG